MAPSRFRNRRRASARKSSVQLLLHMVSSPRTSSTSKTFVPSTNWNSKANALVVFWSLVVVCALGHASVTFSTTRTTWSPLLTRIVLSLKTWFVCTQTLKMVLPNPCVRLLWTLPVRKTVPCCDPSLVRVTSSSPCCLHTYTSTLLRFLLSSKSTSRPHRTFPLRSAPLVKLQSRTEPWSCAKWVWTQVSTSCPPCNFFKTFVKREVLCDRTARHVVHFLNLRIPIARWGTNSVGLLVES
eukprot:PhF_6_TR11701/c0_g1_i1/m.19022